MLLSREGEKVGRIDRERVSALREEDIKLEEPEIKPTGDNNGVQDLSSGEDYHADGI